MTRLNGEAMGAIAAKVFGERTMTLSEAGAEYELNEMVDAIRAVRGTMRTTLSSLPDTAFGAQGAAEGEGAWSAGQIMLHLANAQRSMTGAVRSLLDMPPASAGEPRDVNATLPSREDALSILDTIEPEFDAFVAEIPADADLSRTMTHARFGEMSTNGWLILMTLHESDHLRQMRALGT